MANPEHNLQAAVNGDSPQQPRASTGRFISAYPERRGHAIALRLPQSLDQQLRTAAGWHSKADNRVLTAWIEAAIAEKLRRQPVLDGSATAEAEQNPQEQSIT